MKNFRRAGIACAAVAAGVLLIGAITSAQAVTSPGWRQVVSTHFGAATNISVFDVAIATSARNAWVFGGTDNRELAEPDGTPVAEHWNGTAWRQFALPKGLADHIEAASAPAADDIWAVTQFGGYILHWNGHAWSVAKRLPPIGIPFPQLTGVVALSATDVWVFGSSGFTSGWGTWHFNGHAWTRWRGSLVNITDGSAVSAKDIWAIGGPAMADTAIERYTGTWKLVTSRVLNGMRFGAIQAFSDTNVWVAAVNDSGSFLLLHYNGHVWAKFTMPWNVHPMFGHIVPDGRGGLWLSAMTSYGLANRYYEVHRTAAGAWRRTLVSAQLLGLAHVPGTASVWGAGGSRGKSGGNAVIWAYGAL
jgi:hypothetical protein